MAGGKKVVSNVVKASVPYKKPTGRIYKTSPLTNTITFAKLRPEKSPQGLDVVL